MTLSKQERLMLYNQYEILKFLYRDDPHIVREYEYYQKIVFEGLAPLYDELVSYFSEDIQEEVSSFVFDVLQLHRILLVSYIELSESDKAAIDINEIKYAGFDGNEETDYYRYANFVLKDMERFPEIYDNGKCILNSHANKIPMYSRMLEKWNDIRAGRYDKLSVKKIKTIIDAKYSY